MLRTFLPRACQSELGSSTWSVVRTIAVLVRPCVWVQSRLIQAVLSLSLRLHKHVVTSLELLDVHESTLHSLGTRTDQLLLQLIPGRVKFCSIQEGA